MSRLLGLSEIPPQVIKPTSLQVVLALIVRVEGGSSNVGSVANVLNGDLVVPLFVDQFDQRMLDPSAGSRHATINLRMSRP
jgi:hypothetical protein